MKAIDKYIFEALDNYPYSLVETIESLDYALSYDNRNTMALCLYGRVQADQLFKYEEAKEYFQQAISININALEVYSHYIYTLVLNEDYEEATKLVDFALTIKGINKVEILLKKVMLLESQKYFKKALKTLKEVRLATLSNEYDYLIDETEKRLNKKVNKKSDKVLKKEKSNKKKNK
jgi:tetratricopeptide (TPR) repeat protein